MTPVQATLLGIVEGLTEFLPVSSTGHLILTSSLMGLDTGDPAVKRGLNAFEVVIQSGALLAVVGYYRSTSRSMILGLFGRSPEGKALLGHLLLAFLPAVVVGLALGGWIKDHLFGVWPVAIALVVGGVVMIWVESRRLKQRRDGTAPKVEVDLAHLTPRLALLIGLGQCLAMWPGTSRSMATIVVALLLGFSPRSAAEFSFLLAIPTLGAATVHDLVKNGGAILEVSGWLGLCLGFGASFLSAWIAVRMFLSYLTKHGMAVFGWYRVALGVLVMVI